MDDFQIRMLAEISAANARVAGYTAENAYRVACGNSPAYDNTAFDNEAKGLETIAEVMRNR